MTTTSQPTLEQIKQKQQATWSTGDYGKIAWLTAPFGDVLCDAVHVRPGATVLDVATGTGHVALAAARRFCEVTAIDYVPDLLASARRRAGAEGLEVSFEEGDAEDLKFADGSFDYVLSALGVMFTADHARAAGELTRVCRPGGTIGLANWTPGGFVGQMLKTIGRHVPPPPGVQPPPRWGTEEYLHRLLGDRVSELTLRTATIPIYFLSAEHFADFFFRNYGPLLKAAEALDDRARADLRADLIELARTSSRDGEGAISDWEYTLAVARRAT